MSEEGWSGLAANGPWALAAGFLLHQVIKAWTMDRQQLTVLMTEFRDALYALKSAVDELRRRIAKEDR